MSLISLKDIADNILRLLDTKPWKYKVLEKTGNITNDHDAVFITAQGTHPIDGDEKVMFFIINDDIREETERRSLLEKAYKSKNKLHFKKMYLVTDRIITMTKRMGNSINKKVKELNQDGNDTTIIPLLYCYFMGDIGLHHLSSQHTIEKISKKDACRIVDNFPIEYYESESLPRIFPLYYTNVGSEGIKMNIVTHDVYLKRIPKSSTYGDTPAILHALVDENLYNTNK